MFSSSFVSAQRQQIVVGGCNAMIKREEEGFGGVGGKKQTESAESFRVLSTPDGFSHSE